MFAPRYFAPDYFGPRYFAPDFEYVPTPHRVEPKREVVTPTLEEEIGETYEPIVEALSLKLNKVNSVEAAPRAEAAPDEQSYEARRKNLQKKRNKDAMVALGLL